AAAVVPAPAAAGTARAHRRQHVDSAGELAAGRPHAVLVADAIAAVAADAGTAGATTRSAPAVGVLRADAGAAGEVPPAIPVRRAGANVDRRVADHRAVAGEDERTRAVDRLQAVARDGREA